MTQHFAPEDMYLREILTQVYRGQHGRCSPHILWQWGVAGNQVSITGGTGTLNVVDTCYET